MKGRLFTVLSVLSLVLCLALGIAWLWTLARASHMRLHVDGRPFALAMDIGPQGPKLTVRHYFVDDATLRHYGGADTPGEIFEPYCKFGFGFGAFTSFGDPPEHRWLMRDQVLRLPHWAGVLLTGVLPLACVLLARHLRARQDQRIREGLCLACGYDLRASKDRCPECGTPISADLTRQPAS